MEILILFTSTILSAPVVLIIWVVIFMAVKRITGLKEGKEKRYALEIATFITIGIIFFTMLGFLISR
jgi:hypothetical protein